MFPDNRKPSMDTPFNLQVLPSGVAVAMIVLVFFLWSVAKEQKKKCFFPPPKVPGLPVIGNLHQLKEKQPYKIFTTWAEKYGSIYSIQTGANTVVVISGNNVAKEAMVTKYSSLSSNKLTNALKILSGDKGIISLCDYNNYYMAAKRNIVSSTLGANAQKKHRVHRDTMMTNLCEQILAQTEMHPSEAVNCRDIFESEIFGLAMKQAIGEDPFSIYVEEFGRTLSRTEMLQILVHDPFKGGTEVDWRDFFPYLKWIPNNGFEKKVHQINFNWKALTKALVEKQRKRMASGLEINCYIDYLICKVENVLSEKQLLFLVGEAVLGATDTTLIVMEWAMYHIAKDPKIQNRLFLDIQNACGSDKLTEEKLQQIPYLVAVFNESLRKYSPVPIFPPRYVDEDIQLGGYDIKKGTEIVINIYGCNMDKDMWDSPEEWIPDRFLKGKHETLELYKTMSHGAGKRACPGALQVMLITCMAIGRLVQEFEWGLMEGEDGNADVEGLTTHKAHPLRAIVKPRM